MNAAVVKRTQEVLGPFVNSPALAEKFLQKPPLRFLHDVFLSVAKDHGILAGLFDEEETQWSEAVAADKDAKAFFIAKVINYISVGTKSNLDLKPARVCAGQDPEKTNHLLQLLGKLLKEKSVDNKDVVTKVKSGEGPVKLTDFSKGTLFLGSSKTVSKEGGAVRGQPSSGGDGGKTRDASPAKPVAQKTKVLEGVHAKPLAALAKKKTEGIGNTVQGQISARKPKAAEETKISSAIGSRPKTTGMSKVVNAGLTPVVEDDHVSPKLSHRPVLPEAREAPGSTPPDSSVPSTTPLSMDAVPILPSQGRPPSARPSTARRAPQRPTTATLKSRQNSLVADESTQGPPGSLKFLEDRLEDSVLDLDDASDKDFGGPSVLDYFVNPSNVSQDMDGLVGKLRNEQKKFLDENKIQEDEGASNVVSQQESARFAKEVEELCKALQKVSRLSDFLTTCMDLLPEDLEDMERDKQRYRTECQTLQDQIDAASRVEQEQLEKLHREQAFHEESVFAVGEEIASTHYRIKEKSQLLERIRRLQVNPR